MATRIHHLLSASSTPVKNTGNSAWHFFHTPVRWLTSPRLDRITLEWMMGCDENLPKAENPARKIEGIVLDAVTEDYQGNI